MTLTPTQKKYREAIAWLLHPYQIAGGKTYLMAVVWIDIAKNWPGCWFNVWDHRLHKRNSEEILKQILAIEPEMSVNYLNTSICWHGKKVQANYPTPGPNPYLTGDKK